MTLDIIEHENAAALIPLIDRMKSDKELWGIGVIRRDFMRSMTNEAFLMSIRSVMQGAGESHVFFAGDKSIYVAWSGKQKAVYMSLRGFITTALMRVGLNVEPSVMVGYLDPQTQGDELKLELDAAKPDKVNDADDKVLSQFRDEGEPEGLDSVDSISMTLKATREQTEIYHETRNQKPYRKQLRILVVEDQIFSQKLLCEILRSVRVRNNNESPDIDAVQGIHDGWKIFLKKAPDMIFIDLNLVDGSGHTLARAIKDIDPGARVVIVTANNFEEELGVARQNNVEAFIAKPYNKKQILDCVESYISSMKTAPGEAAHGATRRLN